MLAQKPDEEPAFLPRDVAEAFKNAMAQAFGADHAAAADVSDSQSAPGATAQQEVMIERETLAQLARPLVFSPQGEDGEDFNR